MKNEKREHPRFAIHQMVEVSFDRQSYIHAEAVNISENGLLCRSEEAPELYSSIELLLEISVHDKKETVQCEGVVVRSDENSEGTFDVGVQFSTGETSPILVEFIKQLEEG